MTDMKAVHADVPGAPAGLLSLSYASRVDGFRDRALLLPGADPSLWIVMVHGHGSHENQLYVRPDINSRWLPAFRAAGAGVLTPNLRDNAWMSPAAAADLHDLIALLRARHGARRVVLFSGSMGGTGNLIYAMLHPTDVQAVGALGAIADLATYHGWCASSALPIAREIGAAIEQAYGGPPASLPDLYERHSVLAHAERLTMPVFLAHGEADALMPVGQSRALAAALAARPSFAYREVPGGNHDSPLWDTEALSWLLARLG